VAGYGKHCNESSECIKSRKFLTQLTDYHVLQKVPLRCRELKAVSPDERGTTGTHSACIYV
jgi:hypothetical protein